MTWKEFDEDFISSSLKIERIHIEYEHVKSFKGLIEASEEVDSATLCHF